MWLAHMIQKPSEKSTHLILISEEGAGKSTFINTLSRLLGAGKVLETTEPEKNVWGPFNSLMINAFLVVLSEVDKRNSFSAEGRIKALITDPTLTINCKGKDQFEVRSCHRFISATNGLDPLVTHKNDRRNVIIRCSDEKVGDFEYFKKLATKMENPITLRSIYYKLKNQELGDWNFRDIPKTQFHENIVEGNKCPLESFMEYFTSKHLGTEFIDLYGKNMYENFEKWKEDYGYQRYEIKSSGELIKRLKNNLKLPNGAIISLPKDRNGIQQRYDINILKKAFNLEEGVKGVCLIPLPPEEDVEEVEDVEASLVMIKGKKYYTCENDIFKYNEDEIGDKVGYYSNGKAIFL
jgi:phage/plasmid-associated DNA primase